MIPKPLSRSTAIPALASRHIFSYLRNRSRLAALGTVLFALLFGAGNIASAQAVTENFGTVNIGTTSSVVPLVFTFATADTLATTSVLTQGATGLDFADAGSDTCVAGTAYSSGQSCTVNVTFTPRVAGTRYGAVVLEDKSGNMIATGHLQGIGAGPQIAFLPGTQIAYATGGTGPVGVVVDGNGDIYFSLAGSGVVFEFAAVNGVVPPSPTFKTVASGFGPSLWMTIDGAGNLYIADSQNGAVKEILAVNGAIPASPTIRTLGSGFNEPIDIAVDAAGNVYVPGLLDGTVKEMLAVNGTIPASPTIKILSTLSHPTAVAVDPSGNVFVSDEGTNLVKEILAVNGSIPASPTIKTLGSGFNQPYGVAVDANGNVYVADYANNALKEILASSGYTTVKALGSGFTNPGAIVMVGSGNIYVGDYGNERIVELDLADPPSLTFASTGVGITSPDSPQTVTIENVGNAALTFPIPSTGDNPSISTNFTLNSSGSSDCTLLTTESSEPATLAPGASCQLPVSFVPTTTGALSGLLVLTDNNLEASASNYISQSITLTGTGKAGFTLGTSPSSVNLPQGSSATSTITVTPQTGFTGTVSLSASGLPSGVTASFSPSSTTGTSVLNLTAGGSASLVSSLPITISGNSGGLIATTTILLSVGPANFTLSNSVPSWILNQGSSTTSTVTVTDQNGFAGSVTLTAANLPNGVTAVFSPNPTTGTSVLTLSASSTASLASSQAITITGTSGALTQSTKVPLTVYPPADFSLFTNSPSGQMIEGTSNFFTVYVDYFNGFNSTIAMSASGLPAGDSVTMSPTTSPYPGYGAWAATVILGTNTAPGVYPITITGVGGGITHSITYTLTIPTPDFTPYVDPALPVYQGGNTSYFIQSVVSNGFNFPISFSLIGQPAGVSFTPLSFPAPGNGEGYINVSAASTTVPGTYPITVVATGGGVTHNVSTSLTVSVPPNFSLSASPAILTVYQGAVITSTVTSTLTGGFNSTISLGISADPVYDIYITFAPQTLPAPGSGSSTMTIGVAPSVPPGTYNFFVGGAGGNTSQPRAVPIQLTVLQAPSFGSVNVGTTAPAIPVTFTFNSAVTLGAVSVVTQGATGQDFTDAGTGSCVANTAYTQGQTCTVNVSFSPTFPGSRFGAVALTDTSGNVIATDYVLGTGVGPRLIFSSGTQTTIGTSTLASPRGIAVDSSGDIYIADTNNNRVLKETPANGSYSETTVSTDLRLPTAVALDGAGNIYIADSQNDRVLKEIPGPTGYAERVVVTGLGYPLAIAIDEGGDIYFANANTVYEVNNDGGYHEFSSWGTGFANPSGLAVDPSGNIFVADTGNNAVKEVSGSGASTTTTTLLSGLSSPAGLALDGEGNLYVSDTGNNRVLELTKASGYTTATTMPGINGAPSGLAVSGAGNLFVANSANNLITEEDFADAPSLTFANTAVGTTSTDSPQTVTVENVGNAALSISAVSYPSNFPESSSETNDCTASTTLSANQACTLTIDFSPSAAGALSGSLVLADNNLNAPAPGAVQNISLSGTGTQATPTITWGAPAAITYGTPLGGTQLNASSTIAGTFTYSPAAGTVLAVGTQTLTATFTPTDTTDYTTATSTVTLTVNQATPAITWPTPAPITYRTPVNETQLNATSPVAGNFVYSTTIGTILGAGQQTLMVTFMPSDTTDYTTATASVTLTVNKATPAISWPTPAPITYGTAIGDSQLNTTVTVAGSFTYSPTAGTVLGAGQQILKATFTPTDTIDYTTSSASVTITVKKATPTIAWAKPAAITFGTPLTASQLNATSTVAGTFTYSPATGTVLNAGSQTLTVTFTPTDTVDYTTATGNVSLTVNKAALIVTWATPAAIPYGTALSATQLDATSNAAGTYSYSPAVGTVLAPGNHTLSVTFTASTPANYTTATKSGSVTLTVNKATPTITWATPAAISFGTKLSGTQLDASASVAGTFSYSPASGTVLPVGNNSLKVTFTPSNTTDYNTATASVTLTVNKATPVITWAKPNAITYGTALSATQLDATSTVAGTFKYSPASGTVLSAGSQALSVTFTPSNTTDYATATASVTLTVNKATPAITWATPKAITHGTPLSAAQLNATSKVAGTFTYSPAAGTVLAVGNQKLTVTFTPTNTADYTTTTASVTLTVNR